MGASGSTTSMIAWVVVFAAMTLVAVSVALPGWASAPATAAGAASERSSSLAGARKPGVPESTPAADAEVDAREPTLIPAPEGIGLARTLDRGDWELAYRYERGTFNMNRSGTRRQSLADVRARGFTQVPTDLDVEIHTLTVAGAPHDRVTLYAELPLIRLDMKSRAADGSSFTMRSRDAGDLELAALWHFMRKGGEGLFLKAGLGIPTGGTHAHGDTPSGRVRFPYPLQAGSGTFHFKPTLLYRGQHADSSWGVRADGVLFVGQRDGYRRGDVIRVNGWYAHRLTEWMSSSLRLGWIDWKNVVGDDDDIDEDVSPAADADRQGGTRFELGPGVSFAPSILRGTRFSVEATWPLYQSLEGPQLESDWQLRAGWRWQF